MPKYVLNSGGIKNDPELKQKFHQELIVGLGKSPKFLLCNFAQGREYWEAKFPGYVQAIVEDLDSSVRPEFELAFPDMFEQQAQDADVVYFHGGDGTLLNFWMNKYNLKDMFAGKVVATNSASSQMLSKSYWTCDWRRCEDGFGILPIKFIAHYRSNFGSSDPRGAIDWQKIYNEFEEYGDTSLPIYALEEGQYEVFNIKD